MVAISRNNRNSNFICVHFFHSHSHSYNSIQAIFVHFDFPFRWKKHTCVTFYVCYILKETTTTTTFKTEIMSNILCALEHLSTCKILIHFRSVKL